MTDGASTWQNQYHPFFSEIAVQDCVCEEIDPSDKPCITCESRELLGESADGASRE